MTTAATATTPLAPLVRVAVLPGLAVAAVAVVVAAIADGAAGAAGALVGAVLVTGFFAVGQLVLHALRAMDPAALFVIAILTYLLQIVAMLAVLSAFARDERLADAVSAKALGVTAIVLAVTWSLGLMRAARRGRAPLYDLDGGAR